MNDAGVKYIADAHAGLDHKYKKFTDSQITERCMRLGIEAQTFELSGEDEVRQMAIATLCNDVKKYVPEATL